jgi:hypothetical protein
MKTLPCILLLLWPWFAMSETTSWTTVSNLVSTLNSTLLQNNVMAGANISVTASGNKITIANTASSGTTLNAGQLNAINYAVTNGAGGGTFNFLPANYPTLSGADTFNNLQTILWNWESFGCNNAGATTLLTANNEHGYRMFFPNYSGTSFSTGFLGLDSPAQSTTTLDLGAASAPASPGVSQIFFDTGATYNANATRWWTLDSSGDLYPYQSNPTYSLGLAAAPIAKAFVSNTVAGSLWTGIITNGFQIWYSFTNTPPVDTNHIYLATVTNMQGCFFVWSNAAGNGQWMKK